MDSEVTKEKIHTEPMLNDPRYITLLSLVVLFFTLCKLYFKNVLMRFTFVFHEITYVLLLLFQCFSGFIAEDAMFANQCCLLVSLMLGKLFYLLDWLILSTDKLLLQ